MMGIKPVLLSSPFMTILAAYIDPNTGGMLFQVLAVLLGVISASLLFFSGRIKSYYYKVRRRVSKSGPEEIISKETEEASLDKPQPPQA
jgi:Na+/melibiose symporter-like transporter